MDAFANNVIDLEEEHTLELRTGDKVTTYAYRATSAHLYKVQQIEIKIGALDAKDPDVIQKRDEYLMDQIKVFIPDIDPDLPEYVSHARLLRIAATCINKAQGDIGDEMALARKNLKAADPDSRSAAISTTPSSSSS